MDANRSSSLEQTTAESSILAAVGAALGVELSKPGRIPVGSAGAYIEVDGATLDRTVMVEAYARQGVLKGSQPKKVARDILKLALVKREPEHRNARTIIAFASPQAYGSVRGWLREAADAFGVELMLIELDAELQSQILVAQARQMMVNASDDA
jgi:hypothetical protein